jgi:hypothetical protein
MWENTIWPWIESKFTGEGTGLIPWIKGLGTLIHDAAVILFTMLYTGLSTIWTETIWPWIEGIFTGEGTGVIPYIEGLWQSIYDAGVAILDGFWGGLKSKWEEVAAWVEEKFGWILDILEEIFNYGSPSKVMAERGKWLMEGFAEGMKDYAHLPESIMSSVAHNVMVSAMPVSGNTTNTTNNNYTLNMPTTATPASVERAFGVMRLMNT